jgi:putative ABC transport system permease protein
VLKALGARDRDIRRVFFVEAASIGLAGGALGVGFGWIIGLALNAIARTFLPADADAANLQLFYVPGWLVAVGLGVSTIVAMVAGIYPAWRAARQDPVVALRRE